MPKAKKPAQNETEEEEDNNMTADDKQLDSITDHHQAHELDVNKVNAELAALQAADAAESQAELDRQKELAKVPVEAADIELIAAEMNLSKAEAEQALRENEGDAKKTLVALVHQ